MLNELVEAIKQFSPYLSAILSINSPIALKVVKTIANYFNSDSLQPSDIIKKIEEDPTKEQKFIEIEAQYKDFEIKIKIGNDD